MCDVPSCSSAKTEVHDEDRIDRQSIITEELVDAVKEKLIEDRRIKIDNLCIEFPNVSGDTIFEIIKYKKIGDR